jgi:hypothetical protein
MSYIIRYGRLKCNERFPGQSAGLIRQGDCRNKAIPMKLMGLLWKEKNGYGLR